jgi:5'-nucleotidase
MGSRDTSGQGAGAPSTIRSAATGSFRASRARYSTSAHSLVLLEVNGAPVSDDATYTLILQGYHTKNCKPYLDVTLEELTAAGPSRVAATSAQTVLKEWLIAHQNVDRKIEGRLVYAD